MNRGIILALSAYIFWGLHPIYWKQLQYVHPIEIISHRIIWSFIFFLILLSMRQQWKPLISKINKTQHKYILFIPALLIGSNWAVYIWAVISGFIVETSLGYFISPLISVFLGVFFLNERLRKLQWFSILIAGVGVLVMTVIYGYFPWIAIYLATTWGAYGLLRKKSPLSSVEGLLLETSVLIIPAILILSYLTLNETASFLIDRSTTLLLIGSGLISGLPLIIFIIGARMIKLSLIGILQYVYPTLIFLTGVYIYNEVFSEAKVIGFSIIWMALILYTVEGWFSSRNKNTLTKVKKR